MCKKNKISKDFRQTVPGTKCLIEKFNNPKMSVSFPKDVYRDVRFENVFLTIYSFFNGGPRTAERVGKISKGGSK